MADDSRQAGAEIEVTAEMIEAGRAAFVAWFELDEHHEGLLELPSDASISSLLKTCFGKMWGAMPVCRMN